MVRGSDSRPPVGPDRRHLTQSRQFAVATVRPSYSGRATKGELGMADEVDYEDLTGVYTVQGLFDELVLRFGQQEISIERRG